MEGGETRCDFVCHFVMLRGRGSEPDGKGEQEQMKAIVSTGGYLLTGYYLKGF